MFDIKKSAAVKPRLYFWLVGLLTLSGFCHFGGKVFAFLLDAFTDLKP